MLVGISALDSLSTNKHGKYISLSNTFYVVFFAVKVVITNHNLYQIRPPSPAPAD
jgi:hypothetical protein